MSSYNLAAIKIVYGALYQDEEFPGIKSNRIDSEQLFAYALAISKNEVRPYYETLSRQLRSVIEERDLMRHCGYTFLTGRAIRVSK